MTKHKDAVATAVCRTSINAAVQCQEILRSMLVAKITKLSDFTMGSPLSQFEQSQFE